jgi:hypothetical protein
MGSEQFSELVPWLMTNLRSEGSAVERSGAAQVGGGVGGRQAEGLSGSSGLSQYSTKHCTQKAIFTESLTFKLT